MQKALAAILVVRSPGGVSDYVLLVVQDLGRLVENDAFFWQEHGGGAEPVISDLIAAGTEIDDEIAAIGGLERTVDHGFHVLEIVGLQARNQVDGKLGVGESGVTLAEKGIGNRAREGVGPAGVHIEIEQSELAIDRRSFRAHSLAGSWDAQRNSGGGDDVEDRFRESRFAEKGGDGGGDPAGEIRSGHVLGGGGVKPAEITLRDRAAPGVIFSNLARERRTIVDHDQDVFRTLRREQRGGQKKTGE